MKRIIATGGAAVLTLTLCVATAAAKADFGGAWFLDKAHSEGLPPGMDQTMTVTLAGDNLSLETRVTTEQGEQTVSDSYVLDGKAAEFTPRAPAGVTGRGTRTAKWTADGNGIEVKEEATLKTPEGEVSVKAERRWTLSPDGKTLKIELTIEDPGETHRSSRTFTRKLNGQ